jgi:hypothetical protein
MPEGRRLRLFGLIGACLVRRNLVIQAQRIFWGGGFGVLIHNSLKA